MAKTLGTPWQKLRHEVPASELEGVDLYWRASNYLSVGQIYLRSNPLMRTDFVDEKTGEVRDFGRPDVKHRLVGHWGTTPGINFLFGHVNRLIADHNQNAIFLMGPGHGGPAGTAQSLLDGTYREIRPDITNDEAGLQKFFRQFSYPGGIPSHFAPETPGSIHEGGELGYTLSHAYGAVMDNPSLLAVAVVGDGESETGPLATSWQSNKLVNPATDGIVLPILHLNGYKIANPTILARVSDEELTKFFEGMGYKPHFFVAGFDDESHASIHERFAALFEQVFDEICDIKAAAQAQAAAGETVVRPAYPMIVFRTPKGWTCPKQIDGKKTEDSCAPIRCRSRAPKTPTSTSACCASGCAPTSRGALYARGSGAPRGDGLYADRRAAHRRQPQRERRQGAPRARAARYSCPRGPRRN